MTVAFVDDIKEGQKLNDEDFKIEWFSGSGAGGQNRNKTQNCCRVIHIPTGIIGVAQTRARSSSYQNARAIVVERLHQKYQNNKDKLINDNRKIQMGSGMRGDKIRTYRFQDDIVTDHTSGKTASVKQVMRGNFHLLW